MNLPLWRRAIAEVFGTFILVWIGCGAAVVDGGTEKISHPGIALTFGMVVTAMIYTLGDLSGAHINPAVSIAFCAARRFPLLDCVVYIAAQVGGALLAALALRYCFFEWQGNLGATIPQLETGPAFVVEFILSFILMLVVLGVSTGAKEKSITAGIAVGVTVAMLAMTGGPATGASMNPARSLGPAIASGIIDQQWIYVVSPITGMLAAVATYWVLTGPNANSTETL